LPGFRFTVNYCKGMNVTVGGSVLIFCGVLVYSGCGWRVLCWFMPE
jgi:hypothetical protein